MTATTDYETQLRQAPTVEAVGAMRSLLMMPIRQRDPVGAIGAYWARPRKATDDDIAALQRLADAAAGALDRIGIQDAPWAPTFRVS